MNSMWTVIRFTFMNKVRTKSFIVTTLIFALLISVGVNLPYIIQLFSGEKAGAPEKIGLVYEQQQQLAEDLTKGMSGLTTNFELVKYDTLDEAALNKDVADGVIEGYIKFEAQEGSNFPAVIYSSEDEGIDPELQSTLQAALQGPKTRSVVEGLTLTDAQINEINTPVQINSQSVGDLKGGEAGGVTAGEHPSEEAINYAVVYALVILFFVTLMGTGNMIASEVTTEKSSRIMEILITSVSPLSQMFGKVIGMFLLGLAQIVTFGVVLVVNLMLPHNIDTFASLDLNLSAIDPMLLVFGIVFYIFGYFLYAVIYAAVGSIVSRTEDLGQAIMPITMLSLAAFYIAIFSLAAPNSTLMKVSAYIPFFSPTSMIVRIGLGNPPMWEILASLAILIVSIFVLGWLSAKIYRTGVLMYGKRPSFKELAKAMKAYKM
ncbi:ABC-2 type transport system permease protein [Paenibacillus uliginis N3/975]|uniref:ABC-2 type transport system permease protein n=1 Tax=Paenibacillus uliginis N3/975 TaxID=1313296 RepID=A0A1X7HQL2_9BACL|nr:ABC transporter permease [Paenibacillus uliginis]SMF90974.1 ABC-2 type transport system permease protein [Paenibacillus uliginis N3/975]